MSEAEQPTPKRGRKPSRPAAPEPPEDLTAGQRKERANASRFGRVLRQKMADNGYRFGLPFARDLGISPSYISEVINGKVVRGRPVALSPDYMRRVSLLLKWPLNEMYAELGLIEPPENVFSLGEETLQAEFAKLTPQEQKRILDVLAGAGGKGAKK